MMDWSAYRAMCKEHNIENPYESEEHYNRAYGIGTREEPMMIRPKRDDRPRAATIDQYREVAKRVKKPKAVKPPKVMAIKPKEPKPRYKPPKIYTEEEIKARRAERRKEKREAFKKQGLTITGKPRAVRVKVELSEEEIKARRVRYAKNYRVKNREKHLAARRAAYTRRKESLSLSAANGSSMPSPVRTSAVA